MLDVLKTTPHKRFNPLTGEWVLVSPHRLQRPWQGKVERLASTERPQYDPKCYLCPGNERAGGKHNPPYQGTFVFDNDFAALLKDSEVASVSDDGLLIARTERGICRVICFAPRHDLTLPEMAIEDIRGVVDVWVEQYKSLGELDYVGHVQIFENKGDIMGCSNPHPHCQAWATETMPVEPAKEHAAQEKFLAEQCKCLLCTYLQAEGRNEERIVCQNDSWMALVPFWAKWPFETMIVSKRHVAHMGELTDAERSGLADIMKRLTTRYDNVFEVSFPYSMGFHQAPTDGKQYPAWHLHAHYYPPLLRSATVQKFMVGFEMLGTPQRDITPESAADRLRAMSEVHFKQQGAVVRG